MRWIQRPAQSVRCAHERRVGQVGIGDAGGEPGVPAEAELGAARVRRAALRLLRPAGEVARLAADPRAVATGVGAAVREAASVGQREAVARQRKGGRDHRGSAALGPADPDRRSPGRELAALGIEVERVRAVGMEARAVLARGELDGEPPGGYAVVRRREPVTARALRLRRRVHAVLAPGGPRVEGAAGGAAQRVVQAAARGAVGERATEIGERRLVAGVVVRAATLARRTAGVAGRGAGRAAKARGARGVGGAAGAPGEQARRVASHGERLHGERAAARSGIDAQARHGRARLRGDDHHVAAERERRAARIGGVALPEPVRVVEHAGPDRKPALARGGLERGPLAGAQLRARDRRIDLHEEAAERRSAPVGIAQRAREAGAAHHVVALAGIERLVRHHVDAVEIAVHERDAALDRALGVVAPQLERAAVQLGESGGQRGAEQHAQVRPSRQLCGEGDLGPLRRGQHGSGPRLARVAERVEGPREASRLAREQRPLRAPASGPLEHRAVAALGLERAHRRAEAPRRGVVPRAQARDLACARGIGDVVDAQPVVAGIGDVPVERDRERLRELGRPAPAAGCGLDPAHDGERGALELALLAAHAQRQPPAQARDAGPRHARTEHVAAARIRGVRARTVEPAQLLTARGILAPVILGTAALETAAPRPLDAEHGLEPAGAKARARDARVGARFEEVVLGGLEARARLRVGDRHARVARRAPHAHAHLCSGVIEEAEVARQALGRRGNLALEGDRQHREARDVERTVRRAEHAHGVRRDLRPREQRRSQAQSQQQRGTPRRVRAWKRSCISHLCATPPG